VVRFKFQTGTYDSSTPATCKLRCSAQYSSLFLKFLASIELWLSFVDVKTHLYHNLMLHSQFLHRLQIMHLGNRGMCVENLPRMLSDFGWD